MKGREETPSAGIIDSQTVKTTENDGLRGYTAGKKINMVANAISSWTRWHTREHTSP